MGLNINTNVPSLTAQRSLLRANDALSRNLEHLSSGRRISRAADDPAGIAISASFSSQVRGLDQAVRNANDGISLVQTAGGSLAEIEGALIRMRELAVASGNGTLSGQDRDNLQDEFAQLQSAIDQVAQSTTFNGIDLLDTVSTITFQVGADTVDGVDTLTFATVDVQAGALSVASISIGSTGDPSAAIANIDAALGTVTTSRATLGTIQNRLSSAVGALQVRSVNLSSANSQIADVDVAHETALLAKNTVMQQSALSILAQANARPGNALTLLAQV